MEMRNLDTQHRRVKWKPNPIQFKLWLISENTIARIFIHTTDTQN